MSRGRAGWALWVALVLLPTSHLAASPVVSAALRGDTDHNGVLDDRDDGARKAGGKAFFLANLDDDNKDGLRDALDEVLEDVDLPDMAHVQVLPSKDLPSDATSRLSISGDAGRAHVFRKIASGYALVRGSVELDPATMRRGVDLYVEATQPATNEWNGSLRIDLAVHSALGDASDSLTMQVAPLVFQSPVAHPSMVLYSEADPDNSAFLIDLLPILKASSTPQGPVVVNRGQDAFARDYFNVAHTALPGGKDMRIWIPSPNGGAPFGRQVALSRLGPSDGYFDVAPEVPETGELASSMNSFGNFEVIPPHGKWTHGQNLWGSGSGSDHPDPRLLSLLGGQRIQGGLNIDTGWLYVGHVDEFLAFVPDSDAPFYRILVAAPALAVSMIRDLHSKGQGQQQLIVGSKDATTVDDLLDHHEEILRANGEAEMHIRSQLHAVLVETGYREEDVVSIPFLFQKVTPADGSTKTNCCYTAYQPGMVNLLSVGKTLVLPDPLGPKVKGSDFFKDEVRHRLVGYDVKFVRDFEEFHREDGDVHCATNAIRETDAGIWSDP